MKLQILFILLTVPLFALSQHIYDDPKEFRPTLNEIKMNSFEKDSTANAVVLYEIGNSYVDRDHNVKTQIKRKIKILNKKGFNESTIKVFLYKGKKGYETIEDIIATTYNFDRSKVITTNLEKKEIYKTNYSDQLDLVQFALPNVKKGSVITYSYTLTTPFVRNFRGWSFQSHIPTLYSEYIAFIPGIFQYNVKLVGDLPLSINESKIKKDWVTGRHDVKMNCSYSRYAMENVPAFTEEKFMTSEFNYLPRIQFNLISTTSRRYNDTSIYSRSWDDIEKEIRTVKSVGRQLSKPVKLEDYLTNDIINEVDDLKKAKSIFNYVKETYTWNERNNIFSGETVHELEQNKSGNSGVINIKLHNLLKAANIKVMPVLSATRNLGFPTIEYPTLTDYNYLFVQAIIKDKIYLLDATNKYLSFGEIPFKCLNSYARLLDFENGSKWIEIKPTVNSSLNISGNFSIKENFVLSGEMNKVTSGYFAIDDKKKYFLNKDNYQEIIKNEYKNFELSNVKVANADKNSPKFSETYHVNYTPNEFSENDICIFNPFLINFFEDNPFKLQERTYPVDFGFKKNYFYSLNLDFGNQYTIVEKPQNKQIRLPHNTGLMLFSTHEQDGIIKIMLRINFNETIYPPEYYPYLKEFIGNIINTQNNSVILLKKK